MRSRPIVPCLDDGRPLPDPRSARQDLVATGGTMSVERLEEAYRNGIFPWTSGPVTWWSPDPRAVLDLNTIHVPRSLEAQMRKSAYEITVDMSFDEVIEACASAPRADGGTWITPDFVDAYKNLHRAGLAHSLELRRGGQLVAGIYGVAIQGLFAGESMFHREPNASKIALVELQRRLRGWGFTLFDTQMVTPVTELLGARAISRDQYLERLRRALLLQVSPAAWGA